MRGTKYSVGFEPIYYLGWIIQPTIEGFEVYPRVDGGKNESVHFEDSEDAFLFVEGQVRR